MIMILSSRMVYFINIVICYSEQKSKSFIKCKSYDITHEEEYEKFKKLFLNSYEKIDKIKDILIYNISRKNIAEKYIKKNKPCIKKSILQSIPKDSDVTILKDYIPRWLPDHIVEGCKLCLNKFGLFKRRHHCRFCGDIYCGNCCYRSESFLPFYKHKVKICEQCFIHRNYI